jgi:hypothetical protein
VTVDLTAIAIYVIGGIFSLIGTWIAYIINTRLKDSQAAATLGAAVKNSLGMMQQVAVGAVAAQHPTVDIALPPALASAVQYVLTHAGSEAARFGVGQEAIAEKIIAQKGLRELSEPTPDNVQKVVPLHFLTPAPS